MNDSQNVLLTEIDNFIEFLSINLDAGTCSKFIKEDFKILRERAHKTNLGSMKPFIMERMDDLDSWLKNKKLPLSRADQSLMYRDLLDQLCCLYRFFKKPKHIQFSFKTIKHILFEELLERNNGVLLNAPLELFPVSEKNGKVRYKLVYCLPVS